MSSESQPHVVYDRVKRGPRWHFRNYKLAHEYWQANYDWKDNPLILAVVKEDGSVGREIDPAAAIVDVNE